MDLRGWDERYRSALRAAEDLEAPATPLVVSAAERMHPGKALDLACGAGRNALWLVEHGWSVTAVDGASAAIETLRDRASARGVAIDARVADLEKGEYEIEPSGWDLVMIAYYLQRDLFEPVKRGVVPGGHVLAIVHLAEPGEAPGRFSLQPGELKAYFQDWEILHEYEGVPRDAAHRRAVAEILARRPRQDR
jgi:SAM-dependent methyltransferase